jgi:histone-lysine N-methyltransferase SETMAR
VLLPDIAYPHTAAHTVETLKKLNFDVLEHHLYSPDLAPSDYHLFDPLQQAIRGRQFAMEQQLKETVLVCQPKAFYSEGMKKIMWQ